MQQQVEDLSAATQAHATKYGVARGTAMSAAAEPIIEWLQYLIQCEQTANATSLLYGARAAIVESTACCVLGLARPALFSMRAQLDMIFSWVYFKDHPVEWALVENSGDGFKMKKDLFRYYDEHFQRFSTRISLLNQTHSRRIDDAYRFLSAHIHSQSSAVIPQYSNLSSVVNDQGADECASIQGDVSSYISDVLLALYADSWASVPQRAVATLSSRLNDKQKRAFFP